MLMHPRAGCAAGCQSNTLRKRAAVGRGVHGICGCDVRGSAEMERETSICLLGRGGSVSRGVRAFPVGNSEAEGRAQQAFDCCMGASCSQHREWLPPLHHHRRSLGGPTRRGGLRKGGTAFPPIAAQCQASQSPSIRRCTLRRRSAALPARSCLTGPSAACRSCPLGRSLCS